ncbi:uncharacterized protein F4822DRAFT_418796 [Hypoxylon trugodes]|uniref:uncharacterized protein n=1 Tax=Hypoxylon trugodes TaxID=326681 RepID=UPI00218E8066|nr:uncharacterized protein F4822DRAFT_418796 [Hypoxylon trugodes]KAI1384129.1 hypothetical protein F4822DRAFT_418796 [Hypoxylon trugodes]
MPRLALALFSVALTPLLPPHSTLGSKWDDLQEGAKSTVLNLIPHSHELDGYLNFLNLAAGIPWGKVQGQG